VAAASLIESGARLDDLHDAAAAPRPAHAADVIGLAGRSQAPARIVVETTTLDIRNGRPAIDHVEAALAAGCHVVTANKGPAAFAYDGLRRRADAAGLSFLFEGAVMDGVPVFNFVRETLPAVRILGFRGVINSDEPHPDRARSRRGIEPALAHAGARHRRGRSIARRRRLGCRGKGGGARQRADGRRHHPARRQAHRYRTAAARARRRPTGSACGWGQRDARGVPSWTPWSWPSTTCSEG
jgi:hypothetical protein